MARLTMVSATAHFSQYGQVSFSRNTTRTASATNGHHLGWYYVNYSDEFGTIRLSCPTLTEVVEQLTYHLTESRLSNEAFLGAPLSCELTVIEHLSDVESGVGIYYENGQPTRVLIDGTDIGSFDGDASDLSCSLVNPLQVDVWSMVDEEYSAPTWWAESGCDQFNAVEQIEADCINYHCHSVNELGVMQRVIIQHPMALDMWENVDSIEVGVLSASCLLPTIRQDVTGFTLVDVSPLGDYCPVQRPVTLMQLMMSAEASGYSLDEVWVAHDGAVYSLDGDVQLEAPGWSQGQWEAQQAYDCPDSEYDYDSSIDGYIEAYVGYDGWGATY